MFSQLAPPFIVKKFVYIYVVKNLRIARVDAIVGLTPSPMAAKAFANMYYGQNYRRLQSVKCAWDKDSAFSFPQSAQCDEDPHQPLL